MSNTVKNKLSGGELSERQKKPLKWKIQATLQRIEEWYDYHKGKVYISFSGGKDSTVLRELVLSIFPNVVSVFCNTGLEFPEIVEFVKKTENIQIIRPGKSFRKIIRDYGYPVISKEQSQFIRQVRNAKSQKTINTRLNGNKWGRGKISEKWKFMINAPFKISDQCCDVMKKEPFKRFEKKTGLVPFIGTMADNSSLRQSNYLRYGCNEFDSKRVKSKPLSFWVEKDVWEYIRQENIPYSPIYDMGYQRTGCIFCMFGVHLEENPNRFQLLKETHNKQWNYCINKLELGKVLTFMGVDYESFQQSF